MFEAMRRKDRQMNGEETAEILKNGEYGIFSSVGEDGYPYGVPVNYIFYNGRIYFHCAAKVGKKLDNLKFSDKACFTVVAQAEVLPQELSTRYQSAMVFGRARRLEQGKEELLRALCARFAPEYPEVMEKSIKNQMAVTDIVELVPEHMTGKRRK